MSLSALLFAIIAALLAGLTPSDTVSGKADTPCAKDSPSQRHVAQRDRRADTHRYLLM